MSFSMLAGVLELPVEAFNGFGNDHSNVDSMYRNFTIKKRDGRLRKISQPIISLKILQQQIYQKLLIGEDCQDACYGFRIGRNIKDNAAKHVGKELVMCFDLRDFFETITAKQVYNVFFSIVKNKELSRYLTSLVTRNGILPQGAPTSPVIANLVCRRLDVRLSGLAQSAGVEYTRYADDLTFSGSKCVKRLIPAIEDIIAQEGWTIAREKTRLMYKNQRQMVTGLVVNDRVSVPRSLRRKLRAVQHRQSNGGKIHWRQCYLSGRKLQGYTNYVDSINRPR